MKRLGFAETRFVSCGTEYCGGSDEARCILCGGIFGDNCACGDTGDGGMCICGLESTCWQDIRPKHLLGFVVGLAQTAWYAIRYRDFYWFAMAFGLTD